MADQILADNTPALKTAAQDRATIQQVFVRVCKDSRFQLDPHSACALAARVVGKHPLDVWMAMPSLDVMSRIAAGTHPAALANAKGEA